MEPELWVADPRSAIDFYQQAFGATVLHRVGDGDDIVAQLAVDEARFWVSNAGAKRLDPLQVGGATSRTLLVAADPAAVAACAVAAGAEQTPAVTTEHGWQVGRIVDPFGHEWEIGHPLQEWPPVSSPGPASTTDRATTYSTTTRSNPAVRVLYRRLETPRLP